MNVEYECFASPFNTFFKKYFSLFKHDKEFGSICNFFEINKNLKLDKNK